MTSSVQQTHRSNGSQTTLDLYREIEKKLSETSDREKQELKANFESYQQPLLPEQLFRVILSDDSFEEQEQRNCQKSPGWEVNWIVDFSGKKKSWFNFMKDLFQRKEKDQRVDRPPSARTRLSLSALSERQLWQLQKGNSVPPTRSQSVGNLNRII